MGGYLCIQNISQNSTSVLAHTGGQIFCKRRSSKQRDIAYKAFQRGVEFLKYIYLGSWYQNFTNKYGMYVGVKGEMQFENEF